MTKKASELATERADFLRQLPAIAGSIVVAGAGALLWRFGKLPLPWLVGSLYAIALARIAGLPLLAPPWARQGGQWIIGSNMGLYFTSAVLVELVSHAPLIVGMAFFSMAMGVAGAMLIVRWRVADRPTAFFSSMPGGASEMANLSDLWNASVDQVAAAHATRVMLVVLIVPLALTLFGRHGDSNALLHSRSVQWQYFPLMVAASLGGVGLFKLLRLPNSWVLGTLLAVAALSILGFPLSGLPDWLTAGGQMLIGISLGCRFGPGFLRKAPAFIACVVAVSLVFLAVTASLAFLLAAPMGLAFPGLVLSFAPGGIAEMSITASHLNLGVPLVVASHVVRTAILTLLAPVAFRIFCRLNGGG